MNYVFKNGAISAKIVISPKSGSLSNAGDGNYKGYAMLGGGTITYTVPGGGGTFTKPFNKYDGPGIYAQVLWADDSGIPGGSYCGISTQGPGIGGGATSFSWTGNGAVFTIPALNLTDTLVSCQGWPPAK